MAGWLFGLKKLKSGGWKLKTPLLVLVGIKQWVTLCFFTAEWTEVKMVVKGLDRLLWWTTAGTVSWVSNMHLLLIFLGFEGCSVWHLLGYHRMYHFDSRLGSQRMSHMNFYNCPGSQIVFWLAIYWDTWRFPLDHLLGSQMVHSIWTVVDLKTIYCGCQHSVQFHSQYYRGLCDLWCKVLISDDQHCLH